MQQECTTMALLLGNERLLVATQVRGTGRGPLLPSVNSWCLACGCFAINSSKHLVSWWFVCDLLCDNHVQNHMKWTQSWECDGLWRAKRTDVLVKNLLNLSLPSHLCHVCHRNIISSVCVKEKLCSVRFTWSDVPIIEFCEYFMRRYKNFLFIALSDYYALKHYHMNWISSNES